MPPFAAAPSDFSRMVVKPAGLVSGRGIVVHFAAVARAIVLPPTDALDELAADFRRRGAPGEQMLGAVDLRRLRKDRRAAVAHQDVGRGAKRRIGGDARIAVRTAALERERQLARRRRRALGAVERRQHGADALHAGRDRLARAPGRLDRHAVERFALDDPVFFLHAADLKHFAAKPDHQGRANVGISGVAPLRAHRARRNPRPWRRCRSRCHARARSRRRHAGSRQGIPERSTSLAISRATVAEQFTEVRIAR